MVQDMFDPEYFLGVYTIENRATGERCLKTGLYRDIVDCPVSETLNCFCDSFLWNKISDNSVVQFDFFKLWLHVTDRCGVRRSYLH